MCIATGRWFSPSTPVFSTNKTDRHDIAEILVKVALNTITLPYHYYAKTNNWRLKSLYLQDCPQDYCEAIFAYVVRIFSYKLLVFEYNATI